MTHPGGSPPRRGREPPADVQADRRSALALVPVSRETEARLAVYADLLIRWQHVKNLVGPSTLGQIWTRHIADSAQLYALAPGAKRWADMGSGAGFPGMVIAIRLRGRTDGAVHLIESNARKCAFLREAARECDAPAIIHNGRVEEVLPGLRDVEVITARALAPLPRLLELGRIPLERGATGLFLKSEGEIGAAGLGIQDVRYSILTSKTSKDGRIVVVSSRVEVAGHTTNRTETEGFV